MLPRAPASSTAEPDHFIDPPRPAAALPRLSRSGSAPPVPRKLPDTTAVPPSDDNESPWGSPDTLLTPVTFLDGAATTAAGPDCSTAAAAASIQREPPAEDEPAPLFATDPPRRVFGLLRLGTLLSVQSPVTRCEPAVGEPLPAVVFGRRLRSALSIGFSAPALPARGDNDDTGGEEGGLLAASTAAAPSLLLPGPKRLPLAVGAREDAGLPRMIRSCAEAALSALAKGFVDGDKSVDAVEGTGSWGRAAGSSPSIRTYLPRGGTHEHTQRVKGDRKRIARQQISMSSSQNRSGDDRVSRVR